MSKTTICPDIFDKIPYEDGYLFIRRDGFNVWKKEAELIGVISYFTKDDFKSDNKNFMAIRTEYPHNVCCCSENDCNLLYLIKHLPLNFYFGLGSVCIDKYFERGFHNITLSITNLKKENGECKNCQTVLCKKNSLYHNKNWTDFSDKVCDDCVFSNNMIKKGFWLLCSECYEIEKNPDNQSKKSRCNKCFNRIKERMISEGKWKICNITNCDNVVKKNTKNPIVNCEGCINKLNTNKYTICEGCKELKQTEHIEKFKRCRYCLYHYEENLIEKGLLKRCVNRLCHKSFKFKTQSREYCNSCTHKYNDGCNVCSKCPNLTKNRHHLICGICWKLGYRE